VLGGRPGMVNGATGAFAAVINTFLPAPHAGGGNGEGIELLFVGVQTMRIERGPVAVRQGEGGGEASGTSHFLTSVHAGRAGRRRHAVRLGSNNPTPLERALEAAIKAVRWLGVSGDEANMSSHSRKTRDGRRTAEEPAQALPSDDRPTLRLSRTAPDVFRRAFEPCVQ